MGPFSLKKFQMGRAGEMEPPAESVKDSNGGHWDSLRFVFSKYCSQFGIPLCLRMDGGGSICAFLESGCELLSMVKIASSCAKSDLEI